MNAQLAIPFDVSKGRKHRNSKKAFEQIKEYRPTLRDECRNLIANSPRGLTRFQIAKELKKPLQSICARCCELKILNQVEEVPGTFPSVLVVKEAKQ